MLRLPAGPRRPAIAGPGEPEANQHKAPKNGGLGLQSADHLRVLFEHRPRWRSFWAGCSAGWHNHQKQARTEQVLYGAYTVADVWTFLQMTMSDLSGERPRMEIVTSREYAETSEAATIVLLLKSIVGELLQQRG